MSIASTAQEIIKHALYGPAEKGGQKVVRNSLSPAFENLIIQLIRSHLIKSVKDAVRDIEVEFESLKALAPETLHSQFDLSIARIRQILQSIYK